MKITKQWLEEKDACSPGVDWALAQDTDDAAELLLRLSTYRPEWMRWLMVRLATTEQNQKIAVFSARLALPIWEDKCPDDKRPRLVIESAERCIADPTRENKETVKAAVGSACAIYSPRTNYSAGYSALENYAPDNAAYAAASAIKAVVDTAYAVTAASKAAAYATYATADDTNKTTEQICEYVITLLGLGECQPLSANKKGESYGTA